MDSSDSYSEDETLILLDKRQSITDALLRLPYDLIGYLERAVVHGDLGYPDLAAGDTYKALLLCDECVNEGFEYHDPAWETLQIRSRDGIPAVLQRPGTRGADISGGVAALHLSSTSTHDDQQKLSYIIQLALIRCYRNLAISLLLCGCLKSAFEFCTRGLAVAPDDEELLQAKEYIENMARGRLQVDSMVEINDLPDQGLVRREIYPWNDHEPNRFSQETLSFLNGQLQNVAPKCEVRVTELPTLLESASTTDDYGIIPTNKQLGLFAKEDIGPGETVLFEHSLLAANNRLKETLCDACSTELPPLTNDSPVVACPNCDDIMFCNEECLTRALEEYHPAVCDKDVETVAKDVDPKEKASALYLHLLARALAMAVTQEVHPLELNEVKYIWGDFLPSRANAVPHCLNAPPPPIWTLPFSFQDNIAGPLHVLEKMDIDIYATLADYDLWVLNTLYSKFRGTASARVNTRTGHPEVAAVHPFWCLANHDCDPNVQWEWGGRMKLWCREKRYDGRRGGIKAGEEILNHYCDIDLKVLDRREWAKGSLGGWCMCTRCRTEAAQEMVNGHVQTNGSSSSEQLVNGVH